jgi:hypothetical protein
VLLPTLTHNPKQAAAAEPVPVTSAAHIATGSNSLQLMLRSHMSLVHCLRAWLQVLLPALTHHPKLQVLELPGCCLTDASATRLAALLKAQAAAAAQQAWMEGLRGGTAAAAAWQQRRGQQQQQQYVDGAGGSSRQQPGLRVLDLAQNQVG